MCHCRVTHGRFPIQEPSHYSHSISQKKSYSGGPLTKPTETSLRLKSAAPTAALKSGQKLLEFTKYRWNRQMWVMSPTISRRNMRAAYQVCRLSSVPVRKCFRTNMNMSGEKHPQNRDVEVHNAVMPKLFSSGSKLAAKDGCYSKK